MELSCTMTFPSVSRMIGGGVGQEEEGAFKEEVGTIQGKGLGDTFSCLPCLEKK